jgi:CBS domain containing-hemolysin-like protein
MDASGAIPAVLITLVLILVNGFFVAAEYAFVRVRRTQLEEIRAAGSARARLAVRIEGSLDTYISASQLGVTLASLAIGWIGEPAMAALIAPAFTWLSDRSDAAFHIVSFTLAFGVITYLHVVIGELAPKYLSIQRALRVALWCALPLHLFYVVLSPFISFVKASADRLVALVGIKTTADLDVHSEEELRMLVASSTRKGILQESERVLLGNVLDFADTLVRQVMVPRTEMVAVPEDTTVAGVVQLLGQSPFTRIPVYREDLDHVVGVIHVKDVVGARPDRPARELMRKPLYLPETAHLDRALAQFRRERVQLAIVIDEFGGTAGLVTLEDVIEELVGEVQDEFDREGPMIREENGSLLVNGLVTLADAREHLGLELADEPYDTVGGMIFGRLGRLAQVGDSIDVEGYRFTVAGIDGRRVAQVKAKRIAPKRSDPPT